MSYRTIIMAGLLVMVTGGCSQAQRNATNPPTLAGERPVPYQSILPQLTSGARKVAGKTSKSVTILGEGLPHVQKISQRPIVGVAEAGEWFFYATSAVTDEATHQPRSLISGYAIKKGGKEIIECSVW